MSKYLGELTKSRWERGDKNLWDGLHNAHWDIEPIKYWVLHLETLFERSESFVAASFDAPMNEKSECLLST